MHMNAICKRIRNRKSAYEIYLVLFLKLTRAKLLQTMPQSEKNDNVNTTIEIIYIFPSSVDVGYLSECEGACSIATHR
jgi:hypothetical protein